MTNWNTEELVEADKRFVWHPFTPDLMVLGKGLIVRYLPLAITLSSEELFSAFNGSVAHNKALAYGHGYTGNALGCAAAKASLDVWRFNNAFARKHAEKATA